MDAQLKRGMLEACVLAVLQRGDSYGYQIIKDLGACIEISESCTRSSNVWKRPAASRCIRWSITAGCANTTGLCRPAGRGYRSFYRTGRPSWMCTNLSRGNEKDG